MWAQVFLAMMPDVEEHLGISLSLPLSLDMGDSVGQKNTSPSSPFLAGHWSFGGLLFH